MFKDDAELRRHSVAEVSCPAITDVLEPEGISEAQKLKLKSKKKLAKTEKDRWYNIYKTLFPDDQHDDMPSPCKL